MREDAVSSARSDEGKAPRAARVLGDSIDRMVDRIEVVHYAGTNAEMQGGWRVAGGRPSADF